MTPASDPEPVQMRQSNNVSGTQDKLDEGWDKGSVVSMFVIRRVAPHMGPGRALVVATAGFEPAT